MFFIFILFISFWKLTFGPDWNKLLFSYARIVVCVCDWYKYFHAQINFFHTLRRWSTRDLSEKQESGIRSLQKFWQKFRLRSYSKCLRMPLFSDIWSGLSVTFFLFCEAGKCICKITVDILDWVFNLSSGIQSSIDEREAFSSPLGFISFCTCKRKSPGELLFSTWLGPFDEEYEEVVMVVPPTLRSGLTVELFLK